MKIKVYTLNAFAKTINGGNPAGVVLDSDSLSPQDMQKIAAKLGFSETAFIKKSDKADFNITFFTPNAQVDLCGHATIATFSLLLNKDIIKVGEYTLETKAGILKIECRSNNVIYMNQPIPKFYEMLDRKEIAASLNIAEDEILLNSPIQIVSTGLKDIIIPIKSLNSLYNIKPDFDKISNISAKYNTVGYHLFSLETELGSTANSRNFAPLYDIPEEAATGTSNGALSCYLYKYGLVTENNARSMVFEQGYSMKKPSEILASIITNNREIIGIKVGGVALNIQEKIVN